MTEIVVPLSLMTCAFLDTAKNRKQAVDTFRKLHRMPDESEIPEALAVSVIEHYYAQNGGKPWLRPKESK